MMNYYNILYYNHNCKTILSASKNYKPQPSHKVFTFTISKHAPVIKYTYVYVFYFLKIKIFRNTNI